MQVSVSKFTLETEFLSTQPTAQKLETTNCRKIDNGNPNNSANTDIYAYSETTFGWSTVGSGMTENWTYAFCRIWEDVSDTSFGTHIIWTQKNSAQNPFCEPY